jgi:hypothetical protein
VFAEVTSIPESIDPGKTDEERLKRFSFRRKVALEILATEQSFVAALNTLQRVYIKELLLDSTANTGLLTAAQSSTLFSNIPVIQPLQQQFLLALQAIVEAWTPDTQEIGPLFVRYAPFFKMFAQVSFCKACSFQTRFV